MPTASTLISEPDTLTTLATRYAGDLIYKALMEAGEPLKTSEVARAVGRDDVDVRLARVILITHAEITSIDRKWTLWTRFLDTRSAFDNIVRRIYNTFGRPIPFGALARELSEVYGRPAEIYEEVLTRYLVPANRYFRFGDDLTAPSDWLLWTEEEAEEEVLFDNFLRDEETLDYVDVAESVGLNIEDPTTVAALLEAVGKPLKNKAIQFLAWRRNKAEFDAAAFFAAMYLESGATLLSDGTWIGPTLERELAAQFPILAEQEVKETVEAEVQEPAPPLTLGDHEREQLVQSVLDRDMSVLASQLLEDLFEITSEDRTYAEDLNTVLTALKEDERVVWVGGERFRPQGSIPAYVYSVPRLLELQTVDYMDSEGNLIDQLLEDDGLDGGLEREILNPLSQDVLDEEPAFSPDPNPPSNVRVVIKYHHKQIGTMPLCQFPSGFFPPEPTIVEVEFLLPGGIKTQVWVNNETRLLYGLLDWFQAIPIDSGATFTLERQSADRFIVGYNDESEPSMFISRNRLSELLSLQERTDTEELSTFDIMRQIMEHYRKGIEYLTLLTEVNVVRRVSRRMVASLLSEYHCFFQRGGAWVYDAKKLSQGFDKSKRKYLVK